MRGTKVGWQCEADFLRLKNAVFLGWSGESVARAEAQATVFVLGVIPAWPHPLKNTGDFKDDEKKVPGLKPRLWFCAGSVSSRRLPLSRATW